VRFKYLPMISARLLSAIFCADFLTMLLMNVCRLYTHWLPAVFFALLGLMGILFFQDGLIFPNLSGFISDKEQFRLAILVLAIGLFFAGARLPYLMEGHLHHLVGPVVYDDTWHLQEINSLVNSLRYPAQCSLVPGHYFSLYYAPWMLIAALYLAIPVHGFTIKAAFAIGCAMYQVLICLALLYLGIARAHSRKQLYWAIYLIGCWAGIESVFSALYYVRHNARWMMVAATPFHFPSFSSSIVWAVHHLSTAVALMLCWYVWDTAKERTWRIVACCSLLIAYGFYGSIFVFLGTLPLGLFAVSLALRDRWKSTLAVACLSGALIWPLLWLYLGKTSDVRFLFPFISGVRELFPFAADSSHLSAFLNRIPFLQGMWPAFLLFLIFIGLNFIPYVLALVFYGKRLSRSNRIFTLIAIAFLISTYFVGFQEGDNYASRGYLVPILVLGWVCAGLLPSIRAHAWIVLLLLLGAFGSVHDGLQTYKRAILISRTSQAGPYDAEILALNRDRHRRTITANEWQTRPDLIYDIEKFVAGGKSQLVTADRQLICAGPTGPWRWQQIPQVPAK
jgi:hypothetical protein